MREQLERVKRATNAAAITFLNGSFIDYEEEEGEEIFGMVKGRECVFIIEKGLDLVLVIGCNCMMSSY